MNLLNRKGIVIRSLPRHDNTALRQFSAAGVATLHEAYDRQGLMARTSGQYNRAYAVPETRSPCWSRPATTGCSTLPSSSAVRAISSW